MELDGVAPDAVAAAVERFMAAGEVPVERMTKQGRRTVDVRASVVRASVEAAIGWDFGPAAIVEDAQFALEFAARYPGRTGWFPARCYGVSPATLRNGLASARTG